MITRKENNGNVEIVILYYTGITNNRMIEMRLNKRDSTPWFVRGQRPQTGAKNDSIYSTHRVSSKGL